MSRSHVRRAKYVVVCACILLRPFFVLYAFDREGFINTPIEGQEEVVYESPADSVGSPPACGYRREGAE